MSSISAQRYMFSASLLFSIALVFSGTWEFLALQAPYTTGSISSLSGPVSQLREHFLWLFMDSIALSYACSRCESINKVPLLSFSIGSGLLIAILTYGASSNMMSIQADDPRSGTLLPVVLRITGYLMIAVSHFWILYGAWRATRANESKT